MSNNTIFLVGGGLVALYFLTKKSPSENKINSQSDKQSENKQDKIYQIEVPKNQEDPIQKPLNSPGFIPGFVPNANPINPNPKPKPNESTSPIPPKSQDPKSDNSQNQDFDIGYLNLNPNSQTINGLKNNPTPTYKTIIVKAKATPGFYYQPTSTDNYYGDPLLEIAVDAYGLLNLPENVILTYARQINKVPYNIRFQHVLSTNYLPYNKRLDTSKVYGTLEQQFNDPVQGAIYAVKKGFQSPFIYIPLEKDFF